MNGDHGVGVVVVLVDDKRYSSMEMVFALAFGARCSNERIVHNTQCTSSSSSRVGSTLCVHISRTCTTLGIVHVCMLFASEGLTH